jgi:hypothetical protein
VSELAPFLAIMLFALGILVSILLNLCGRRRPQQIYWYSNHVIMFADHHPHVAQAIATLGPHRLTLADATLIFWNGGSDVIYKWQLSTNSPLRITVDAQRYSIYSAYVRRYNDDGMSVGVAVDRASGSVNISFNYLNPGAGAAIGFLHSDLRGSSIKLSGTVQGVTSFVKFKRRAIDNPDWPKDLVFVLSTLSVTMALIIGLALKISVLIADALLICPTLLLLWLLLYGSPPNTRIPRGL